MTMPIKHAKGLIGELVGNFDSDGRHMEAWDTILAHIEGRVVTDEDVRAAYFEGFMDALDQPNVSNVVQWHDSDACLALQAALGVGK